MGVYCLIVILCCQKAELIYIHYIFCSNPFWNSLLESVNTLNWNFIGLYCKYDGEFELHI